MARQYRFAFAAVPHAVAADGNLIPTDCRVVMALLRIARRSSEVLASNEQLAELLGVTAKTIQNSLRRLEKAGWIRRITDFACAVQRRIELVWLREPAEPPPPADEATSNASMALNDIHGEGRNALPPRHVMDFAPPGGPPPLYRGEEEDEKTVAAEPRRDDAQTATASHPSGTEEGPRRTVKRDSPEVQTVVRKAENIWGSSPGLTARVIRAAKRYSLSWVDRALDLATAKVQRSPVHWGYVDRCLENWTREGGPPPLPAAPVQKSREQLEAEARAERERNRAPDPTPPTSEDVSALERWASGADGPSLKTWAEIALGRYKAPSPESRG